MTLNNAQLLEGKTAIITGASSGIGWASARLFARQGASLVVGARRSEKLLDLATKIQSEGGKAVALAGDVSQESYSRQLVELALDQFGGLDIAMNNAGSIGAEKPLTEISSDDWYCTIATNLHAAFYGAKYQVPALQKRGAGSLLFTSSFVGYTAAFSSMADYAASKAGLIGFAKALAIELGGQGIRVNALLPGGTDTEMNIANKPGAGPEILSMLNRIHPLGRLASADEIAHAALFLASDLSSFVTASALLVDGGVSMSKV